MTASKLDTSAPLATDAPDAPDDYPGDINTAGTIIPGRSVTGTLNYPGDTDWFRVQLTAGQTYVIAMQGSDSGVGSLGNPVVALQDGTGAFLVLDDDSGYLVEARLTYTAPTSGTYYVNAFSDAAAIVTGSYRVSIDPTPLRADDFSNDRTSDLLLRAPSPITAADYQTVWFVEAGSLAGGTSQGFYPSASIPVGTGDFNYDGLGDFLVQRGSFLEAYFSNQNGQVTTTSFITTTLPAGARVFTGDFNRDGGTDVLIQAGSGVVNHVLNRATGTIVGTNILTSTLPPDWYVMGTGDFNGDGISDVVLQSGSTVVEWLLNASGGYASGTVLTTALPLGWQVSQVGDFNGDFTDDILIQGGNMVVDWIMRNGAVVGGNVVSSTLPAGWTVTGTGDFNADGTDDLSLQGGGTIVNWLMANGQYAGGNVLGTGLPAGTTVVGKT